MAFSCQLLFCQTRKGGVMSVLFSPQKLGRLAVKNRFVHSACEDNMATENGKVTEGILKKNRRLAKGGVGLIIWSHLFVHPLGRTKKFQSGIHTDDMVEGLRQVPKVVHEEGGKIAFQLGHAGIQTDEKVIGQKPMGPHTMTEGQIREVVEAFGEAARRAYEAGVDAVQLHGAHGYLINEFLSPYFNNRKDAWGGSDENRFRLLKEIITAVKTVLPQDFPLLLKLNTNDYTKKDGITVEMAALYAKWLQALGVAGLEVSCGTSLGATWNMCRGDVPVDEMVKSFPEESQTQMKAYFTAQKGQYDLEKPYNIDACRIIKSNVSGMAVFAVGGWRHINEMEDAVAKGETDFIAMCRPFIREPNLVNRLKKGKTDKASCKNCNKCLAALPNDIPVQCYYKGFPL